MEAPELSGRVGAFAVALGMGAAIWTLSAAAAADEGSAPSTREPGRTTGVADHRAGVRGLPATRAAATTATPTGPARGPARLTPAARRAIDLKPTASTASTANPRVSSRPISVAPVVAELTDGIINGTVTATDARGFPLMYTVAGSPDQGGKVSLNGDTGKFAYLPDYQVLAAGGSERFRVLVSEMTPIVTALDQLVDIAEVRAAVRSVLAALYQTPLVNVLLSPLIGTSTIVDVTVDNGALVPAPSATPVAHTAKVTSFDGTPISTNFFPAPGLAAGQDAPTIFTTAGLSKPGQTDPYRPWDPSIVFVNLVPGIAPLREAGYNVVTWDSRGEAASGGVLELGAPEYEGRDFQAIVSHYTEQGWTTTDPTGDPVIGMVGGSYGGGMQLVNAALDPRVDAIVPGIAWNTLTESLYPSKTFNTLWGSLLPVLLVSEGARINPEIYLAAITGGLFGWISPTAEELLGRTGPGEQVADITAPTLLIQGIPDTTFPLNEAVINAQLLTGAGTPTTMIWYCGGHGVCLNPTSPIQDRLILDATIGWLDRYVKDQAAPEIPTFQWVDQFGQFYASDLMPFDPAFNGEPIVAAGRGGLLPIISVLGGGGPNLSAPPLSLLATSSALNAVTLTVSAPGTAPETQIVGSPELTLTYSGIGSAGHLFAQLVDDRTGLVLSNAVTPVPVVLDGTTRTVTVELGSVAHRLQPGASITLQVTTSGMPFYNLFSLGAVDVTRIELSLPTVADGVAVAR